MQDNPNPIPTVEDILHIVGCSIHTVSRVSQSTTDELEEILNQGPITPGPDSPMPEFMLRIELRKGPHEQGERSAYFLGLSRDMGLELRNALSARIENI